MEFSYILIFVILLVFIIVGGFLFRSQSRGNRKVISDDYTDGLKSILLNDKRQALEKLRLAAIKNTDNIDAYIKIGEILRDNGNVENAIKIHRQLTVRKGLSKEERVQIYKSLTDDYCSAQKYKQGLNCVNELLQIDKKSEWALNKKMKLYELMGEWQKAFETLQRTLKSKNEKNDSLLALYKVQNGLKQIKDGNENDARIAFRAALKFDENCVPAHLYLADSYIREKRQKDALSQLTTFVEKLPGQAHFAFDRLRQLLFDMGNFSRLETIYQSLQAKNPDNSQVYLALAKLYERKGNFEEALDLTLQSLEKEPDSISIRARIIRYYNKLGQANKAIEYALAWFDKHGAEKSRFICSECGYESDEPLWYCPKCKNWDTFVK